MSATTSDRRFDIAFIAHGVDTVPGVIPYITAGFPSRDDTVRLLLAAQRAGALAAEVGIPFSDPLADGPTIQRAGWRALSNGMTLHRALEQVAAARTDGLTLPVAVMTYINPVLAFGIDAFARGACDAGVDGLIVPDLPAEEASSLRDSMHETGCALIPMVAPTTPRQRLTQICAHAQGFVYCVSVTGVTGARTEVAPEALRLLAEVREVTQLPRAIGFGISRRAHVVSLAGRAEAVVVGSALIDAIEASPADAAETVESFVRALGGLGTTGETAMPPA